MLLGGARLQTIDRWWDTPWIIKRKEAITITELDEERSIYSWFASTTTPLTWHRTNHLYQFFAYVWGTGTIRKNASVQHWHLCLDSLEHVGDSCLSSHRLNVLPTSWPIREKVQHFHPKKQKIIEEDIDKLLAIGFIRDVKYLDWLANVW